MDFIAELEALKKDVVSPADKARVDALVEKVRVERPPTPVEVPKTQVHAPVVPVANTPKPTGPQGSMPPFKP